MAPDDVGIQYSSGVVLISPRTIISWRRLWGIKWYRMAVVWSPTNYATIVSSPDLQWHNTSINYKTTRIKVEKWWKILPCLYYILILVRIFRIKASQAIEIPTSLNWKWTKDNVSLTAKKQSIFYLYLSAFVPWGYLTESIHLTKHQTPDPSPRPRLQRSIGRPIKFTN